MHQVKHLHRVVLSHSLALFMQKKICNQIDLYILPSLGTEHLYPLTLTGICQALSYNKVIQLHTFVICNCIYYWGKGKAVILISAIKYSISINYELQNTKICNDFFKYWPSKQYFTRQETNVQVKTANGSDQLHWTWRSTRSPPQDCDRLTSHLIKHLLCLPFWTFYRLIRIC